MAEKDENVDRSEQERWEDEELLPIMSSDARRWWLARRAGRRSTDGRK